MTRNFMLACLLSALASSPAFAQDSRRSDGQLAVSAPTFQNAACPIMGKPALPKLFVDTDYGRIYMCCKACVKKIQADAKAAYETAYKDIKKHDNKTCPVTGDAIGAKSPTMSLQGHEFKLCCEGCRPKALEHSQIVLAKLANPKLTDVGNATCPLSGKPVAKNTFVLIGDNIVHLASDDAVEQVRKTPTKVLDKAKAIKEAEDKATGGKPKETGCCSGDKAKADGGCCSGKPAGEARPQ
jgi:hypothetical protein